MKKLLIGLLFALGGCTTLPDQVDLVPTTDPRSFLLESIVVMDDTYTRAKEGKDGFFPGTYTAEKSNAIGTFYRGGKFSIFYPSAFGRYFVRTGGVWVPNDPGRKMKAYCYFNSEYKEVENYDAAISANPKPVPGTSGINIVGTPQTTGNIVGNAIGGAIVGGIIARDTGAIQWLGEIDDADFSNRIRAAIRQTK